MFYHLHYLLYSLWESGKLLQRFSVVSNQPTRNCLWCCVSCKAKDDLRGCRWRYFNFHRLPYFLIRLNYPLLLLLIPGKIFMFFPRFLPDFYVYLSVYLHMYVMRLPSTLRRLLNGQYHGYASLLVLNLLIVDRKLSREPWARVRMVRSRVLLYNGKVELPCPYTIGPAGALHHRTSAPAAPGSWHSL
jgi:hypothetical protein